MAHITAQGIIGSYHGLSYNRLYMFPPVPAGHIWDINNICVRAPWVGSDTQDNLISIHFGYINNADQMYAKYLAGVGDNPQWYPEVWDAQSMTANATEQFPWIVFDATVIQVPVYPVFSPVDHYISAHYPASIPVSEYNMICLEVKFGNKTITTTYNDKAVMIYDDLY